MAGVAAALGPWPGARLIGAGVLGAAAAASFALALGAALPPDTLQVGTVSVLSAVPLAGLGTWAFLAWPGRGDGVLPRFAAAIAVGAGTAGAQGVVLAGAGGGAATGAYETGAYDMPAGLALSAVDLALAAALMFILAVKTGALVLFLDRRVTAAAKDQNRRLGAIADGLRDEVEERARQLIAAQNLANTGLTAKSQALRRIAAHLDGPVRSVLGFTNILREGPDQERLSQRQRRAVVQIEQAAVELRRLSADLRDLAALETGDVELSPGPVSVLGALEAALLRAAKSQSTIALAVDRPPSHLLARADPNAVARVLDALLAYALSRAAPGDVIHVGCVSAPDMISIAIANPARALAPHEIEAADTLLLDSGEGASAGVALYLARRTCEAMGGGLALENEAERGAVMIIHLPRAGRNSV